MLDLLAALPDQSPGRWGARQLAAGEAEWIRRSHNATTARLDAARGAAAASYVHGSKVGLTNPTNGDTEAEARSLNHCRPTTGQTYVRIFGALENQVASATWR